MSPFSFIFVIALNLFSTLNGSPVIQINVTHGSDDPVFVDLVSYPFDRFGEQLTVRINNNGTSGLGANYVSVLANQDASDIEFRCSTRVIKKTEGNHTTITKPTDEAKIVGQSLFLNGDIQWCKWSIFFENGRSFPFEIINEPKLYVTADYYSITYQLEQLRPIPPLDIALLHENLKPLASPASGYKYFGNARYILFEKANANDVNFIFAISTSYEMKYKPERVSFNLINTYGINVECNFATKMINGSLSLGDFKVDGEKFITGPTVNPILCSWTIPTTLDYKDGGKFALRDNIFDFKIVADKRFDILQSLNFRL